MEDRNRNQGNQSYNQNWEQNRSRRQDDRQHQQSSSNQGFSDLDGDGFIGNTGGFYGGTSYLGANYNDWSNNMAQGNQGDQYGGQNQQRNRGQQDYQRSNRNRDDQYYYNQDNPYGNQNYQGMSGQGNNVRYGHGFENQQYNSGNRSSYGQGQDYNRGQENRAFGTAGSYDPYGGWTGSNKHHEQDERDEWYGRPYGRRQQSSGNNNWGSSGNQDWRQQNRNEDRSWLERAADKVTSWFGDGRPDREQGQQQYTSGPHRGKGPKGYQRSSDRIRDDIHDRLHDDPYVDASEIEVEINQNEVILKGYVDSREAKRRAEDVVENISGVRHVENRLRVGRPDTHFGSSSMYQDTSSQNQNKGKGDTDRDITV
jgi:osmotically-inducible protein OsmY